jgi:hypothetical protein
MVKTSFFDPERFPLDSLLPAMGKLCMVFQSSHCYTADTLLRKVHGRALRSHELGIASLPPSDRHNVPIPSMEGLIDDLPELLVRYEFDSTCVPDGVWWINVWSTKQVETVGLDRILTGDWFRMIEQPNGGLMLVLTEAATDVRLPEHREKLATMVEHLRLRELQERYRLPSKPSSWRDLLPRRKP